MSPERVPTAMPLKNPTRAERSATLFTQWAGMEPTAMARITTAWLWAPLLPPTEATTGM